MIADPEKVDDLAIYVQMQNVRRGRVRSRSFAMTDALRRVLPGASCKLNGIWGERDQVAAGQVAEREAVLRAIHPDIDFRVVPGAGHWVAYEAPEIFNPILLEMLAASPARGF
jgi:pimeloyl-ACP methyl ester carboxylesterase